MKQNLITLLFVFTVINMVAQTPGSGDNIVTNKVLTPIAKVPLDIDAILIYDYDGILTSYNLDAETINWTVKATDSFTEMCANGVTLHDGVVYVPFINGEIFAVDNQDGNIFWKSRIGNITDQIVLKDQTPVISNGKLFITSQNENSSIYALNLKDGSLAWSFKLDSPINHTSVFSFGNKVFTESGTSFYSFDANTGKVLSQRSFEQTMSGKPVTDGENVIVANEKDVLFALNPNNMETAWQFKLAENQHNIKERIFCKDKMVYFAAQGSEVSSVYAVDTKTGNQLWKKDFKDDNIKYITQQDETLWGYTRKGKLFQLHLERGEIVFEAKLTTAPVSNIEFPDVESIFYYCDAGLIQYEIESKDENMVFMRTSIKDDVYSANIKIIK